MFFPALAVTATSIIDLHPPIPYSLALEGNPVFW